MRKTIVMTIAAAALLAGCSDSDDTDTEPADAATPAATTASSPDEGDATQEADGGGATFAMPDLVGMDLDTASDTLSNDYGIYVTLSHDVRGDRDQTESSEWIVCTQSIDAGEQVSAEDARIDLGAVNQGESCP